MDCSEGSDWVDNRKPTLAGLAESCVRGDREDKDVLLGGDERQPRFVIEVLHDHFSTPQGSVISNTRIIPKTHYPRQAKNTQNQHKTMLPKDLQPH